MTIQNRLKILIAEKEFKDGMKLSYRVISKETGLSTSTLSMYVKQSVNRFDASTIEAMCIYFDCQPGDILVFSPDIK